MSLRVRLLLVLHPADQIRVNRTLFTHVPLKPIRTTKLAEVHNPTVSGEGGTNLIEAAYGDAEVDTDAAVDGFHTSAEQLSRDLTSLSLAPRSRWQTLLQLDLIRVCITIRPIVNPPVLWLTDFFRNETNLKSPLKLLNARHSSFLPLAQLHKTRSCLLG